MNECVYTQGSYVNVLVKSVFIKRVSFSSASPSLPDRSTYSMGDSDCVCMYVCMNIFERRVSVYVCMSSRAWGGIG